MRFSSFKKNESKDNNDSFLRLYLIVSFSVWVVFVPFQPPKYAINCSLSTNAAE